jgi:hypothetical protein
VNNSDKPCLDLLSMLSSISFFYAKPFLPKACVQQTSHNYLKTHVFEKGPFCKALGIHSANTNAYIYKLRLRAFVSLTSCPFVEQQFRPPHVKINQYFEHTSHQYVRPGIIWLWYYSAKICYEILMNRKHILYR